MLKSKLLFASFLVAVSTAHGGNLLPADEGYTELHEAAARGDTGRIQEFLANGRFREPAHNLRTALHVAAQFGQTEALQLLLQDENFLAPDIDGQTALHVAARFGQVDAMRVLLRDGRFCVSDRDRWTPLHAAARCGRIEALRMLLADGRFDAPGTLGWTPLHIAAQLGQLETVRVLIQDGRFNRVSDDEGWSALHAAVDGGNVHLVRMLLDDGRFNAPAPNGNTALHIAARNNQTTILRMLLADGRFNRPNSHGQTALHEALRVGQVEAARVLLEDGRFNAIRAFNGDTVLHVAARSRVLPIVRLVIFHFPRPSHFFGYLYADLANEREIGQEISHEIRRWRSPSWDPSFMRSYPPHLRRTLTAWQRVVDVTVRNLGFRDIVAEQIVRSYYAAPEDFNPYNERNTRLRLERHRLELDAAREQEVQRLLADLAMQIRIGGQNVAK